MSRRHCMHDDAKLVIGARPKRTTDHSPFRLSRLMLQLALTQPTLTGKLDAQPTHMQHTHTMVSIWHHTLPFFSITKITPQAIDIVICFFPQQLSFGEPYSPPVLLYVKNKHTISCFNCNRILFVQAKKYLDKTIDQTRKSSTLDPWFILASLLDSRINQKLGLPVLWSWYMDKVSLNISHIGYKLLYVSRPLPLNQVW